MASELAYARQVIMENLVSIFLTSVFVGNILLAYFLGMCSFVAISKNMETSIGLGFAVVFVLSITTPMNWLIYTYLLSPGALAWVGLPRCRSQLFEIYYFHRGYRRHGAGG